MFFRQVFTNSDISEGWVVRCTCGVTKDDGRDMIECETCKTWQHVKCVLGKSRAKALPPGQEFTCTFCQAADADVPHSRPTQARSPLSPSFIHAGDKCALANEIPAQMSRALSNGCIYSPTGLIGISFESLVQIAFLVCAGCGG